MSGNPAIVVTLADEAATIRLGEDLALALRQGDCLALSGDLGAGKSTLFNRLTSAEAISVVISGEFLAMVVIGGMRSFLGPALGALVHNAGSLFVVGHAATLLRRRPGAVPAKAPAP